MKVSIKFATAVILTAGALILTGATENRFFGTTEASFSGGFDESIETAQANNLIGKTTIDAKAGTVIIPNVVAATPAPAPAPAPIVR